MNVERANLPEIDPAPGEVTEILAAARRGEAGASDQLYEAVYAKLRRMARGIMRGHRAGPTMQPTALVHEAYLRLMGTDANGWQDRRHFFGCAASAMRSILVDAARARGALKRGGDRGRIALRDDLDNEVYDPDTILSIHEALEKLDVHESDAARIVELRFFAGLGIDETAEVLGVSRRTAYRRWDYARLWLYREIAV